MAAAGGGGASSSRLLGGDPNPPAAVPVRVRGVDVTHVEMTDVHNYSVRSGRATIGPSGTGEIGCPGGNDCHQVARVLSNGTRHVHSYPALDEYGADFHARIVNSANNTDEWFDGYAGWGEPQFYGTRGQYSTAYTAKKVTYYPSIDRGQIYDTYSAALGELHVGRPAASATWTGGMVGTDIRYGSTLTGTARITYSVGGNTVDVAISSITELEAEEGGCWFCVRSYSGPTSFAWNNVPVQSDGSFYMQGHSNNRVTEQPHHTRGFIEGDFYGPNAAETAGVFERNFVSGGWSASKN